MGETDLENENGEKETEFGEYETQSECVKSMHENKRFKCSVREIVTRYIYLDSPAILTTCIGSGLTTVHKLEMNNFFHVYLKLYFI